MFNQFIKMEIFNISITKTQNLNMPFYGLNANNFLGSAFKQQKIGTNFIDPSSTTEKLVLKGLPSDYSIRIENGNIIVTKRKNNGFGKDTVGETQTIKIGNYKTIGFEGSPNFEEIAIEKYPNNKLLLTEEGYKKNNLYRSTSGVADFVRGGAGSDQFRATESLDGDIFFGGDGIDTLYLKGKSDDYNYKYIEIPFYGKVLQISKKSNPNDTMIIGTDVEKIRFTSDIKNGSTDPTTRKKVRSNETIRIDELEGVSSTIDLSNLINSPGNTDIIEKGTQSNDTFTWDGDVTGAFSGLYGTDTLEIASTINIGDLIFEFAKDKNNRPYLSIKLGRGRNGELRCYDLEKIKLPDGTVLTLEQLKKKLDGDGKYIIS